MRVFNRNKCTIARAGELETGDLVAEDGDEFMWVITEVIQRTDETTKIRVNGIGGELRTYKNLTTLYVIKKY